MVITYYVILPGTISSVNVYTGAAAIWSMGTPSALGAMLVIAFVVFFPLSVHSLWSQLSAAVSHWHPRASVDTMSHGMNLQQWGSETHVHVWQQISKIFILLDMKWNNNNNNSNNNNNNNNNKSFI